jgi:hypothetical protein
MDGLQEDYGKEKSGGCQTCSSKVTIEDWQHEANNARQPTGIIVMNVGSCL